MRPKDEFLELSVMKWVLELCCVKVNMLDLIDTSCKFSIDNRSKDIWVLQSKKRGSNLSFLTAV